MLNVQFSNLIVYYYFAAQSLLCCCEVIKAKILYNPHSVRPGQILSDVIGGFYMKNVTQNMMFIGRLIEALGTGCIMLMTGLFFPPTSHFLPPLFSAEACHFPSPTQYLKSINPSSVSPSTRRNCKN